MRSFSTSLCLSLSLSLSLSLAHHLMTKNERTICEFATNKRRHRDQTPIQLASPHSARHSQTPPPPFPFPPPPPIRQPYLSVVNSTVSNSSLSNWVNYADFTWRQRRRVNAPVAERSTECWILENSHAWPWRTYPITIRRSQTTPRVWCGICGFHLKTFCNFNLTRSSYRSIDLSSSLHAEWEWQWNHT